MGWPSCKVQGSRCVRVRVCVCVCVCYLPVCSDPRNTLSLETLRLTAAFMHCVESLCRLVQLILRKVKANDCFS